MLAVCCAPGHKHPEPAGTVVSKLSWLCWMPHPALVRSHRTDGSANGTQLNSDIKYLSRLFVNKGGGNKFGANICSETYLQKSSNTGGHMLQRVLQCACCPLPAAAFPLGHTMAAVVRCPHTGRLHIQIIRYMGFVGPPCSLSHHALASSLLLSCLHLSFVSPTHNQPPGLGELVVCGPWQMCRRMQAGILLK